MIGFRATTSAPGIFPAFCASDSIPLPTFLPVSLKNGTPFFSKASFAPRKVPGIKGALKPISVSPLKALSLSPSIKPVPTSYAPFPAAAVSSPKIPAPPNLVLAAALKALNTGFTVYLPTAPNTGAINEP